MKEFISQLTGVFLNAFLQYPVCYSLAFTGAIYILYPVYYEDCKKSDATTGRRWIASCCAIFVLLSAASISFIPILSLAPDRVIFRPTPSCSTFDNPTRYICLTLDVHHGQAYYVTTWRKCSSFDSNMNDSSNFYHISSWIPSPDHFVTTKKVLFQPESSPGENKPAYHLPDNYCVRATGPTECDEIKVGFYSINATGSHIRDTGPISKEILKEYQYGWYLVSNCRIGIIRWLYNCTTGYVSSKYVRLRQYTRVLLLEP